MIAKIKDLMYKPDSIRNIGRVNSRNGMHTIEVAEKHGFGTTNYELIDIDE